MAQMSREIKFRAWNQIDSEYINEINAVMSLDGSHIWWDINDSGDMKYEDDPRNYKLEQYTGLKDANDNPIYEGDIVKYTAEDGDSFLAPVKYFASDGYPAFDIPTAFIPYWHFESNVLSAGMAENSIEVVGNIHDSPELLEAQHE